MASATTGQSRERQADRRLLTALLLAFGLIWVGLAFDPVDRRDWFLENLLTVAFVAVLLLTHRRFTFSRISYSLMAAFLVIHTVGAHYTYAEVPAGFWLQQTLHLSRNPFDRIAHFAYGLLLVYPLREVLVRLAGVQGAWSFYLPANGILAQSGLFEVIEAVVAMIVSPELGSMYLGTQGDEWDAQKDMLAAFAGSILTMTFALVLSKSRPLPLGPA